jgi:hypothetical protein
MVCAAEAPFQAARNANSHAHASFERFDSDAACAARAQVAEQQFGAAHLTIEGHCQGDPHTRRSFDETAQVLLSSIVIAKMERQLA